MANYAGRTTVAPARTRAEIEHELERRGATAFGYNRDGHLSVVAFTLRNLQVRMALDLPDPDERQFTHTPRGQRRSPASHRAEYEQAVRARWRALLLVVKAKLVAVDEGITTLEREFLADVVLPATGTTVLEEVLPAIDQARKAVEQTRRAIEGTVP